MCNTPLARLIRARMDVLNLSQAETRRRLARCGVVVSPNVIKFWLDGHMPALRVASALAAALEVELSELCEAADAS